MCSSDLAIPDICPGVPSEFLNPRNCWPSTEEYDRKTAELAGKFRDNFAAYAGIVDHVSFQVMHRLGITEGFTNDKHFKAAGFNLLF